MIQLNEIYDLINYAKKNNLPLAVPEEELQNLIERLKKDSKNLKYSNDDFIDMVIDKVQRNTKNSALSEFLKTVNIKNIPLGRMNACAYYSAGEKHEVKADCKFLRSFQQLSDIAGVILIYDICREKTDELLCNFYLQYLAALVYAFDNKLNENYEPSYQYAEYLLSKVDEKRKNFSDCMMYFSREVFESALAFIVGHEIGHHYNGDIEQLIIRNFSPDEYKTREYAADDFGVIFALEYMNASISDGNAFNYINEEIFARKDYRILGILLVFQCFIYLFGNSGGDKHPRTDERLRNVIDKLQKSGVNGLAEAVNELKSLQKLIDDTRKLLKIFTN